MSSEIVELSPSLCRRRTLRPSTSSTTKLYFGLPQLPPFQPSGMPFVPTGCRLQSTTTTVSAAQATAVRSAATGRRRRILRMGPSLRWPHATSLDYRVRAAQDLGRDREPERPGGPEIHDRVELLRLLHRQVAGTGAPEDAVGEDGGAAPHVGEVHAEGEEAARVGVLTEADARQAMARGERGEAIGLGDEQRVLVHHHRLRARLRDLGERALEVVRAVGEDLDELDAHRSRRP